MLSTQRTIVYANDWVLRFDGVVLEGWLGRASEIIVGNVNEIARAGRGRGLGLVNVHVADAGRCSRCGVDAVMANGAVSCREEALLR